MFLFPKINRHNFCPKTIPADGLRVGIIGGRGQMGQLLAREFTKDGHQVEVTGENLALGLTKRALRRRNQRVVQNCDVIILAVPIKTLTNGIYGIIGRNRRGLRGKLIVDICSTKLGPVQELMSISGPTIIGLHPLFGPKVVNFVGQNVAICPLIRDTDRGNWVMEKRLAIWTTWLENFWYRRGAKIVPISAKEHDALMPVVQLDVLLSGLTYGAALKDSGADLRRLKDLATPNSRLITALVGRVTDPQMVDTYTNLVFENPNNLSAAVAFADNARRLVEIIAAGRREDFIAFFHSVSECIDPESRAQWQGTWAFIQQALAQREFIEQALIQRTKSA